MWPFSAYLYWFGLRIDPRVPPERAHRRKACGASSGSVRPTRRRRERVRVVRRGDVFVEGPGQGAPSACVTGGCDDVVSHFSRRDHVRGRRGAFRSVWASASGIRHTPPVDAARGGPSPCRRRGCRASSQGPNGRARPRPAPLQPLCLKHIFWGSTARAPRGAPTCFPTPRAFILAR